MDTFRAIFRKMTFCITSKTSFFRNLRSAHIRISRRINRIRIRSINRISCIIGVMSITSKMSWWVIILRIGRWLLMFLSVSSWAKLGSMPFLVAKIANLLFKCLIVLVVVKKRSTTNTLSEEDNL
jgi:hypothetical protein